SVPEPGLAIDVPAVRLAVALACAVAGRGGDCVARFGADLECAALWSGVPDRRALLRHPRRMAPRPCGPAVHAWTPGIFAVGVGPLGTGREPRSTGGNRREVAMTRALAFSLAVAGLVLGTSCAPVGPPPSEKDSGSSGVKPIDLPNLSANK